MLNPVSLVVGEDDTVSENAGECVNSESMLAYIVIYIYVCSYMYSVQNSHGTYAHVEQV